ncbi:isochorismatase family protein [Ancylobacter amanitiformis]|uniref:Bifunctional isochorismate lyase/aryl carrier protein n=1 Tax=Ancylobacter amanitiformis TaxID=217069 RepID=A0ABU0LS78_9HYPH|nr:isochorismatase family protein [Ancylobacter amanitiformis]MDQ0511453.1 bifunctional isochorismate lyase/aryl carrier protein [Ancylobacter amanitiformis]
MSAQVKAGLPAIAPYDLPRADELPAPRAPWRLERARAALLIHDMQNYFLRVFTPDASPIAPVIANIAALAQAARGAGVPVFYTAQDGDQDRRDRGLQADLWGPGMSWAPEHQPIVGALAPRVGDIVLVKHRYSAFQRSNLETLMRARDRDQIIICGVYAHIGCTLTAADAFMRDIEPFLAADALADFSRAKHDLALSYVADTCGVPLTSAQIREQL